MKKEDEIYCPNCDKLLDSEFKICPYCNANIKKILEKNINAELKMKDEKEMIIQRNALIIIITVLIIVIIPIVIVMIRLGS